MNKELEKKYIEEFPKLFRDMYGDPRVTCMAWGCTIGEGWDKLLYETCVKIQKHCDENNLDFKFTQVKEKFGMLTLYCQGADDNIRNIITEAEKKSVSICDICGSENAKLYTNGWLRARCRECENKEQGV